MYLLYLRIYKNGRTKACMISYDHYMWLFVITTGYALGVNAGLALKHENAEGKRGSMMKRVLCVVIAALMVLTVFCSCGKGSENSSADTSGKDAEEILAEMTEKYADKGYPVAVIVMENGGTIALELYNDVAPNTVNNFISLANSGLGLT